MTVINLIKKKKTLTNNTSSHNDEKKNGKILIKKKITKVGRTNDTRNNGIFAQKT